MSKGDKKREISEIRKICTKYDLYSVKYNHGNRHLIDKRDYIIVLLSVKYDMSHSELVKIFNFKGRSSINQKIKSMIALGKNKEFMDNIKEIYKAFPLDLSIDYINKQKSSGLYYTMHFSLSGLDIAKIENIAAKSNYPVREFIHNYIKSL